MEAGHGGLVLAHDYATQRGGAERVALMLAATFPGAPMYTALYDPPRTFPEFGSLDLRRTAIDRSALLRRNHRLALPLLASAVSRTPIEAELVLASSSGWAHGFPTSGRKVVYCHAPARWLYQGGRYLGGSAGSSLAGRARRLAAAGALGGLGPALRRWDRAAALSADRYLANSTVTQRAVREVYGIDAEVLPPPAALLPDGEQRAVPGVEPGFVLCVARLLPYKNVDLVLAAVRRLPGVRLVVVGDGPDRARLEQLAAGEPRVRLLGRVDDAELRWLYASCALLAAASYEDYGLSPLEAAAFGRPAVALHDGGYLDTVDPGVTGTFFDDLDPDAIAAAIDSALARSWDRDRLVSHPARIDEHFSDRLRQVVAEELGHASLASPGRTRSGKRTA